MTYDTLFLSPGYAKAIKDRFDGQAPMSFMGMRVIESPLAKLPARRHKKRRWMSDHYHQRIQKKWNKRFGYVPAAFLMNSNAMLDFLRPFPPLYKSDLAAFQDWRDGVISVVSAAVA